MLKTVVSYVYHYGLFAAICCCFVRGYRTKGMGLAFLIRKGVHRVGTLWALPTLQSFRVWRMLRSARKIDVILTLEWGGGAAAYVDGMIRRKANGEWSIVVKPIGIVGCLFVEAWDGKLLRTSFVINSLKALYGLRNRCDNIIINNLIQWHYFALNGAFDVEDYEVVIEDVLWLMKKLGGWATYMVHDYFSICPRWTLMMDESRYCASEYKCEKCGLCLSACSRTGLAFRPGLDIYKWRLIWRRLLDACDEVRTFSDDTWVRMRLIYPEVKLTLVPHQPVIQFDRKPNLQKRRLVIGVFGNLTVSKGAGIVVELVRFIRERKLPDDVVVVGELNPPKGVVVPIGLVVTGKFQAEQLVDLVEKHDINMAFFPSVWPETFSYVVQELMMMDLPIVCFDIGAPRGRVREYDKGLVCHKINAEDALQNIHLLASRTGIQIHA